MGNNLRQKIVVYVLSNCV
uniref:Uncharacterized protein n=1 Tax=Rhizophora mucronata TaxID=61149 RepID=A0A2P2Q6C2_RHIMU